MRVGVQKIVDRDKQVVRLQDYRVREEASAYRPNSDCRLRKSAVQ